MLLAPLSAAYGAAVAARAALYRIGWLKSERVGAPVISVGNLAAGGTGKTPVAALVAGWLRDAGWRPAIVSRGYGGRRRADPLVVSDGISANPGAAAAVAGDEPVMLARLLPDVAVVVARRRAEGARLAVSRLGARCLVLDDGFQHLALLRDLDLVLLDAGASLDAARLLPAGILRERPSALSRANAIVLTGNAAAPGGLEGALARWARPGTPIFHVGFRPTYLLDGAGGGARSASWLSGKRVVAFAGIARPGRLAESLQSLGAEVVSFLPHPDHHPYTAHDIARIVIQAKRDRPDALVTTEKDLARLEGTPLMAAVASAGVAALRVEAVPEASEEAALRDLVLAAARVVPRAAGEAAAR